MVSEVTPTYLARIEPKICQHLALRRRQGHFCQATERTGTYSRLVSNFPATDTLIWKRKQTHNGSAAYFMQTW